MNRNWFDDLIDDGAEPSKPSQPAPAPAGNPHQRSLPPLAPEPEDDGAPPPLTFRETCKKCQGRGRFIGYSGRSVGNCFACKGVGFFERRTAPETRAKAKVGREVRKVRNAQAIRDAFAQAHPEVWAWINANREKVEFAENMFQAIEKWGDLTEGQLAACQKWIDRRIAVTAERETRKANAPTVDASKLEAAFALARAKADRPNAMGVYVKPLNLQSGDKDTGHALSFRPGSQGSQWEGQIFVREGEKKLGVIKAGKFEPRFECSDVERAAVLDVCQDPAKAAVAYGKAWSRCSVCGLELTNPASIDRGIGPICAERYGF